MRCDVDPEAQSRRRAVASLLVFAKEIERAGRISKASKDLLKELIVHENLAVMSVGEALARADGGPKLQAFSLQILEEQIKNRASKSHQELFEICPLEQAHLLSQQDTEALAEGSDTKSLVYGEVDFWSFYEVIKVAADGINVDRGARNSLSAEEDEDNQEEDQEEGEVNEEGYNDRKRREDLDGEVAERNDGGAFNVRNAGRSKQSVSSDGSRQGGVADDDYNAAARQRCSGSGTGPAVMAGSVDGRSRGAAGRAARGRDLKFVDLGSGSGKAVFAAVLAVDFRCAVGIEVLAGVHRASIRVLRRYRKLVEPVLSSPAVIKLHHGCFLDPRCDWSDGDLVFANSTCFAEDTMMALAGRAELLLPGARVVTFTTALKTPWLRVLGKRRFKMSWGPATVFIHQKLSRKEYAQRLKEGTPFDEDQGISRKAGNGYSSGGAVGGEDSAPRAPALAPAWSLPCGERLDEEEEDDEAEGGSGSSSGSGFEVHDGVGDEASETSGGGDGVRREEEEEGEGEEGRSGTERGICSSSPQRPMHC